MYTSLANPKSATLMFKSLPTLRMTHILMDKVRKTSFMSAFSTF